MDEMSPTICFSDSPLVFDASALINIAATGYHYEILEALGTMNILEEVVRNEISSESRFSERTKIFDRLIGSPVLSVVSMDNHEASRFINFVMAPEPDSLDDGEAATLAVASNINGIAVIDEKKGCRIAASTTPKINTITTPHLFKWISDQENFPTIPVDEILYNALSFARMRVPIELEEWVAGHLSPSQICGCTSLRKEVRKRFAPMALPPEKNA